MSQAILEKVKAVLSPETWALVEVVGITADSLSLPAYLVGGVIRDAFLFRKVADLDFVFEGNAITLAEQLVSQFGGELITHDNFYTATWTVPSDLWENVNPHFQAGDTLHIDLISTRSEIYETPAALPSVTLGSLTDDLRRRDFTINAMAMGINGEQFGKLFDPFGGQQDLAAGIMRVLHDKSFIDDPTRLFRGVRFAQRLGFDFAKETLALIPDGIKHIDALSGKRIFHELDLILREDSRADSFEHLDKLGILHEISPNLGWYEKSRPRFTALTRSTNAEIGSPFILIGHLALLLYGNEANVIESVLARLDLSQEIEEGVKQATKLIPIVESFTTEIKSSELVFAVEPFDRLGVLAAVSAYFFDEGEKHQLIFRYRQSRHINTNITGNDLIQLGLKPKPIFKAILKELRRARIDGKTNEETEFNYLQKAIIQPFGEALNSEAWSLEEIKTQQVRQILLNRFPEIIETSNAESSLVDLSFQSPIIKNRHVWISIYNTTEIGIDLEDRFNSKEWDDALHRVTVINIDECCLIISGWLFNQ